MSDDFQDYYELLELSPNANPETIERTYRYLATKVHPDAGGDKAKFGLLVKAFETLKDPVRRAEYDKKLFERKQLHSNLVEHASQAGRDTIDRHKLLCLYYAQRRQDPKHPALGAVTVETLMKCGPEVLDFHIWYFREKGWIKRADNGGFAITAEGVDRVESGEVRTANRTLLKLQKLEGGSSRLLTPTANTATTTVATTSTPTS